MVKRIKTYEVQILPKEVECSKLSERNAETYHTAAYYSEPLLKKIVSEFETALKKEAGLDKIVRKTTTQKLKKGSIDFEVKATPSNKVSYLGVGKAIQQYLTHLETANDKGLRRDGIRRIDHQSHISIDELVEKMDELIEEHKKPYTGFKLSHTKLKDDPYKTQHLIDIEPGSYHKVTGENAKIYRLAKEQLKLLGAKVTRPFKDSLKKETKYSLENIPNETTVDSFEVGRYRFMVTSIPRTEVKYGEVAKDFIKYVHECEEDHENVREREGVDYLPISNLVQEYESLLKKHTKDALTQTIDLFPNPKYENVLVSFG
jgi:hypothetical protein